VGVAVWFNRKTPTSRGDDGSVIVSAPNRLDELDTSAIAKCRGGKRQRGEWHFAVEVDVNLGKSSVPIWAMPLDLVDGQRRRWATMASSGTPWSLAGS
jgi:hypothetical protein